MALYTAETLNGLIGEIKQGKITPAVLVMGERFLIRQAAERLCAALLKGGGTIHTVDGSTEPFTTTINKISSFSLLPGRQIFRVSDTRLFHSVKIAESLWKKAAAAHLNNHPDKAARYLRDMLAAAGLEPEDPENDPGAMSAGHWKKLFSFTRPEEDLSWTAAVLAQAPPPRSAPPQAGDNASVLEQTLEAGIPGQNIVILLAEDVDKRKRLFKYLKNKQTVLDLSVETGTGSRAKTAQAKVQHELIRNTLAPFGKTMTGKTAELLCERVGFHPVAVVMETEKLALFTGDRKQITPDDLDQIVGRTRQEALFELTDALGRKQLEQALLIADRLGEHGVHPLALVATLKNYSRNLLLFRALQEQPDIGYRPGISANVFQQQVLPRLKQKEQWKKELSGHPYALYMQFKTAAFFPLATLKNWLQLIQQADMRLKGSPVEPETVIQHLLINMLAVSGEQPEL